MRLISYRRTVLSIALLLTNASAQYPVSAIYLLISPSASANGMGGIGAALPTDSDPLALYYNPANYLSGQQSYFAISRNPKSRWLPRLTNKLYLHSRAVQIGLRSTRFPLTVYGGLWQTYLDLGKQFQTSEIGEVTGTFQAYMEAKVLTVGVGWFGRRPTSPRLSVGWSLKRSNQVLAGLPNGDGISVDYLQDIGLLGSLPYNMSLLNSGLSLRTSINIGYAEQNMGGAITFIDEQQKDPPPTQIVAGFSASAALYHKRIRAPIIDFRWGREVRDIAITLDDVTRESGYTMQFGLGDIDIWEHIVLGNLGPNTTYHVGQELTIASLITIRQGRYQIQPENNNSSRTRGTTIHLTSIVEVVDWLLGSDFPALLPKGLSIDIHSSSYSGYPITDTSFKGATLTFQRR